MASLDSLAPELHDMIFRYLVRPLSGYPMQGFPRTMGLFDFIVELPKDFGTIKTNHPFYNLAATCRGLRLAVEMFCKHLVFANRNITTQVPQYTPLPDVNVAAWTKFVQKGKGKRKSDGTVYRKIWLKCTFQRCIWCGKKSSRMGNFDLFIWCCAVCDKVQYGKTIVSWI
jgi:hypothetical protein